MRSIVIILLLTSLGCRQVSQIEFEAVEHPSTPFNLDFVERCALLNQWESIRQHLIKVDGDSLPAHQKPVALYWMGMSQYYLGHAQAARSSWERAQGFHPEASLAQKIQRAQKALNSYDSLSDYSTRRKGDASSGTWALQYGVFSLRKSAEDLAKELSWKGLNLQISYVPINGQKFWTVWSGPYSGLEVRKKQEQLSTRNISSVVKPSRTFLL